LRVLARAQWQHPGFLGLAYPLFVDQQLADCSQFEGLFMVIDYPAVHLGERWGPPQLDNRGYIAPRADFVAEEKAEATAPGWVDSNIRLYLFVALCPQNAIDAFQFAPLDFPARQYACLSSASPSVHTHVRPFPSPVSGGFLFRHGAPSTDRERRIMSGFESLFSERLCRDGSSRELSLAVFDYGNY
jgi:hypothetical protein